MASRAEHGVCQDERRRLHLLKTPFSFLVSFLVDYLLGDRNLRPCCPRDLKYTRASQQSLYLLSFFYSGNCFILFPLSFFHVDQMFTLFFFFCSVPTFHGALLAVFNILSAPLLPFSDPFSPKSRKRLEKRKKQEFSRRGN